MFLIEYEIELLKQECSYYNMFRITHKNRLFVCI